MEQAYDPSPGQSPFLFLRQIRPKHSLTHRVLFLVFCQSEHQEEPSSSRSVLQRQLLDARQECVRDMQVSVYLSLWNHIKSVTTLTRNPLLISFSRVQEVTVRLIKSQLAFHSQIKSYVNSQIGFHSDLLDVAELPEPVSSWMKWAAKGAWPSDFCLPPSFLSVSLCFCFPVQSSNYQL